MHFLMVSYSLCRSKSDSARKGWQCIELFFFSQDRYADARAIPPIDEQQDYDLTGFQESGGKTLLKFKRKFDTCDTRDRKLEVRIFM